MSLFEDYHPLKGKMFQILKPDGTLHPDVKSPLSDQEIFNLYQKMVFIRLADQKALMLQRQGRMGTYAPIWGQEACQVGSASVLQKGDWVFPAFRELGASLMMGVPLKTVYLYWMGNEEGSRAPDGINMMPVSIPVGTHPLHAVGTAWAAKIKGDKIVTVSYFGDGATSKGDFHEAMNLAGVFKVPTIFFCQNNQFAISVPRKIQTASETIAQKAVAYGVDGIQVDGNDLFAAYAVTKEAVDKARSGGGATLIEGVTYRFGPHTTADDPTKYRREEEVEPWKALDPLVRLRFYLKGRGLWSDEVEKQVIEKAQEEIDQTVKEAEAVPTPSVEDIFKYVYAEMTPQLKEQMEYLKGTLG
ncbi:MAG: pyruvate dehydrogenase (acetyl-transferring) E1 component subunit alpha [Deltaproteobacteria bacterium]|nr:pyruvate dehydrogenase (acetyl-transferring) E1 component subunit alpha [Deltaproteobacteria bacterium]MBM4323529.1 pyruvate dehydrogenase (acetyl-transferring) E1 component subunit alpha [Deltaproteobacteria bacterium]MBM4347828.1 pyruvate dehydrogenase (acetyl-transferring) E1 component subunit alpha [Deltaproteobacteria bacterium]